MESELITVDFAATQYELTDNAQHGVEVELILSSPAKVEGNITIHLSTSALPGRDFTIPTLTNYNTLLIPVAKHQSKVSFRVSEGSNLSCIHQSVIFSIAVLSDGFSRGSKAINQLLIRRRAPVEASFKVNLVAITEREVTPVEVMISFSEPALTDGRLTVSARIPGQFIKFKTEPPMQSHGYSYWSDADDYFTEVSYKKNDTTASFTIIPEDNELKDNDYDVVFTISSSHPCLVASSLTRSFTLIILDDD